MRASSHYEYDRRTSDQLDGAPVSPDERGIDATLRSIAGMFGAVGAWIATPCNVPGEPSAWSIDYSAGTAPSLSDDQLAAFACHDAAGTTGPIRFVRAEPAFFPVRRVLITGFPFREVEAIRLGLEFEKLTPQKLAQANDLLEANSGLIDCSIACGLALEKSRIRERNLASLLGQNDCGIIVLHQDRSVAFSNSAALSLLSGGSNIHLRNGTLGVAGYRQAVEIQTAIDCVIDHPPSAIGTPPGIMMLIERGNGQRPLIAVISAVGDGTATDRRVAVVYLMDSERPGIKGLDHICRLHSLTHTETRLVCHLFAGSSLAEAAAVMKVREGTARGYLKQIFGKTGVNRQADLLHILGRYQRAVRGKMNFEWN